MWARVTKTYFEELKVSIKATEPILKNSKLHGFIGEIFTSLRVKYAKSHKTFTRTRAKL